MERSYRILTELADFERVFQRLEQDGLFWALDCEWESPEWARWLRSCIREDVLMLEGLVDGEPAGLLKLSPFMARTRCGEIGVAAYRDFFRHAAWLARGACLWCFERMDCESLVGRVAVPNRHALRMAPQVGFRVLGRVPGMCWHGKKQQFVDGVLVLATPESVREAESAPRGASDAGTTFPASESERPAGRGAERHEGGNGVWRGLALCAGAGGLELGLSLALPGYRAVCWVERDAYAASSLVARMEEAALDDAPVWSDLAAFDGRPWRGAVDIVTAGWPCQPFSVSGKRRGSADERHLWPHVRRVLVETGAPLLFAENVPGHVSLGLDVVRADLQDLGYDVEAGLFSAAETGAPHERRRLFLLAHAHRQPIRKLARHILEGRQADLCGREASGGHRGGGQSLDGPVSDGHGPGAGGFPPGPDAFDAWERLLAAQPGLQPALSRTSDGLADRLDRYRLVGNGVCPLAAAYALAVLAFAGLPDCFAS